MAAVGLGRPASRRQRGRRLRRRGRPALTCSCAGRQVRGVRAELGAEGTTRVSSPVPRVARRGARDRGACRSTDAALGEAKGGLRVSMAEGVTDTCWTLVDQPAVELTDVSERIRRKRKRD